MDAYYRGAVHLLEQGLVSAADQTLSDNIPSLNDASGTQSQLLPTVGLHTSPVTVQSTHTSPSISAAANGSINSSSSTHSTSATTHSSSVPHSQLQTQSKLTFWSSTSHQAPPPPPWNTSNSMASISPGNHFSTVDISPISYQTHTQQGSNG